MENRAHALIAGLFTLFLGACVVASVWWFGGKREDNLRYLVTTKKTITGLNAQAQVRYRGINVGKVESIALDPANAQNTRIIINILKNIPITEGTRAKLGHQGVTGIAHILLEDSGREAAPLLAKAGDLPQIPMQDSFLEELSDVGGETLRQARDLLMSANQMLTPKNRETLSRTLENFEVASGNAKDVSEHLKQIFSPENVRALNTSLQRVEKMSGEAAPLIGEARALVARWQSLSEKLDALLGSESARGNEALLPRLSDLSSELTQSASQLNRVLQMLEESPQSLIFGHPSRPPGPGEAGFSAPVK